MPKITLKDNSVSSHPSGTKLTEIAESISKNFLDRCIGAIVNGIVVDLSTKITEDCSIEFLLSNKESEDSLNLIRHSTAHLLAHSVKELFPETQIVIGPAIENGFYYDLLPVKHFSVNDLDTISKKMKEIAERNLSIDREIISQKEAIELFSKKSEKLKIEIIKKIPKNEQISIYRQGDFVDVCRGPHVPNTKFLTQFALTKVSASYLYGDSKNQQLQRIYGTAWLKKSSLNNYVKLLEEASKRDHRKINKELDLFHQQEEAVGDVFWHYKGFQLFSAIQDHIRSSIKDRYMEIKTPQLLQRKLWEESGHWDKFQEDMFTLKSEKVDYALKPMSCPGHIQVFKNKIRSYKDLPLRFSEFGHCYRDESSGAMHGIMRLRSFTQDDGHIFCELEQMKDEAIIFINSLIKIYKDFGFENISIKLSTRPEKRLGSDETWDKSEQALQNAAESTNQKFTINSGEGAFYGPKLEFTLKDALGRSWQCGTLQADLVLSSRLKATYICKENTEKEPVILHRAILGSLERFIGILIEHYAGAFPFWIAPTQVVVCCITNEQDEFAKQINNKLQNSNIRTELDISSQTIGYKIRKHILQKVPYIITIGKKEVDTGVISIRERGNKNTQQTIDEFIKLALSKNKPFS